MNKSSCSSEKQGFGISRIMTWLAILILGFFLWTEHRAHLLGALPYLLLLACPLMHLFHGHGGHGGHHHPDKESQEDKEKQKGAQS